MIESIAAIELHVLQYSQLQLVSLSLQICIKYFGNRWLAITRSGLNPDGVRAPLQSAVERLARGAVAS